MKQGWYQDDTDAERAHYWDGEQWTGESRHISQASPLYSPNGSHYWDGLQWLPQEQETPTDQTSPSPAPPPIASAVEPPRQKTLAEMHGEQPTESKPIMEGPPQRNYAKIIVGIVAVILLANLGLYIINTIEEKTGTGNPAGEISTNLTPEELANVDTSGETEQRLSESLITTAKALETLYTENGTYPDATELTGAVELEPDTTVYIAYYDVNGYAAPSIEAAASYVLCGADTSAGKAIVYSSSMGGLVTQSLFISEGTNPCAQPFTLKDVEWNPEDLALQVKGSQAM